MHNRSDQLAKNILRDALSRACTSETEVEVLAATQKIDVYSVPDPACAAERAAMGLLGELSAEPSLFEPFHHTPALSRVRRCINKQHAWHHELSRRVRAAAGSAAVDADLAEPAQEVVAFPALVVIGPCRRSIAPHDRPRPRAPGSSATWGGTGPHHGAEDRVVPGRCARAAVPRPLARRILLRQRLAVVIAPRTAGFAARPCSRWRMSAACMRRLAAYYTGKPWWLVSS